ncbi:Tetratricopeptide repeat [uncultured Flavonifractor sp.]|nr:Tetratricopeptide repeat [uncultured Flavonifractor sp.]
MAEKNMKYEPLDPDEKLLAEVNEKLKTDPCNPELWYQKGLQHTWKGEGEMALHCFSTGLIYAPFNSSLRTWRGRKLMGQSDYTLAISELATASALNPMDWEAWYYQGVAAYLEGMYEHAKMCHTKARHLIAKHDPLCLAATVDWYWMTCMKLGERDEAKRVVDKYIRADMPAFDGDYLCRTLLYKGDLSPEGFTEKCMANIKNPERPRAYYLMLQYGLANYYHYMGQDDKATPILIEVATTKDCQSYFAVKQAIKDLKERNISY